MQAGRRIPTWAPSLRHFALIVVREVHVMLINWGLVLNGASELFERILTIVAFVAVCAVWAFAGVAVIVGIARWLWRLFRFAPPQWRGHVATATVSGCRKDGERRYVPLVSFVTESGETRTSIPVSGTGYTDPPLPIDQPFVLQQFQNEVSVGGVTIVPRDRLRLPSGRRSRSFTMRCLHNR